MSTPKELTSPSKERPNWWSKTRILFEAIVILSLFNQGPEVTKPSAYPIAKVSQQETTIKGIKPEQDMKTWAEPAAELPDVEVIFDGCHDSEADPDNNTICLHVQHAGGGAFEGTCRIWVGEAAPAQSIEVGWENNCAILPVSGGHIELKLSEFQPEGEFYASRVVLQIITDDNLGDAEDRWENAFEILLPELIFNKN